MHTFILGLVLLFVGGALYGSFCQRVFRPDDRQTPAYTKEDGVDFVPMPKWKNALINLLNIAGTGPILGPVQGILFGPIAIIGVIILPVTSGDTALRSLRLILADTLHIKQDAARKRILLALPVFALAYAVLVWAKNDPNGFNTIWRYFGWSNQTLAVFALAAIMIWLMQNGRRQYLWVPMIPLTFYAFITCSYLMNAEIGFGLPYGLSLFIGGAFAIAVTAAALYRGFRGRADADDDKEEVQ